MTDSKKNDTIKENDIVYLDYDLWIKDTDELYDTTRENVAEENNMKEDGRRYGPIPVVVDKNRATKELAGPIKGLLSSLIGAEVEKDLEMEASATEGYGERDSRLVELRSKRDVMRAPEFRKGDMGPAQGMPVTLDDKSGIITLVTGGRVRVDFNHPLAGRTLKYNYKITKRAETTEEKIGSIIEMNYGSQEGFEIRLENDEATIVLPDLCKFHDLWFHMKARIVTDLRSYVDIQKVTFLEEYVSRKKSAKKEEEDTEKGADPSEEKEAKDKKDASGETDRPEKKKASKSEDEKKEE